MTGLQLGCARADCCQRLPPSEEDDLEAVAGRVVKEMSALNVEDLPVEGADPVWRAGVLRQSGHGDRQGIAGGVA